MMLALVFVCGVVNFAMGKALLESRHPMMEALPQALRRNGGRVSLFFEFLVLLAAMLLAANDWVGAAWLYAAYTLVNAAFGWLVHAGKL
jgi:hypothetical protein